jgi:putative methyltransferase
MKRKAEGEGDSTKAVGDDEGASSGRLPRYGRVNVLANGATVDSVLASLKESGHGEFVRDPTLDDVIVGPVGADLHDHPTVLSGQLILQDKAASLAVRALAAPPGAVAMDATAAPGNKTVQLAGAVGAEGVVHAFDRDRSRYELLNRMLARGQASAIVQARHADFLRVRPDDERYSTVTHILVDPSCSGSGMPDVAAAKEMDAERLDKLVRFQVRMVRHALKFPAVQRVVYSTCSVNVEENEGVLRRLFRDREVAEAFHVVQALPAEVASAFSPGVRLPNFASAGKMVVRTTVADHRTIGFFVSAIARRKTRPTQAS